eukprot:1196134-Prorocentrum_minimum.AAC.6
MRAGRPGPASNLNFPPRQGIFGDRPADGCGWQITRGHLGVQESVRTPLPPTYYLVYTHRATTPRGPLVDRECILFYSFRAVRAVCWSLLSPCTLSHT